MKHLCTYMLCLALVSPVLTSSISISSSSSNNGGSSSSSSSSSSLSSSSSSSLSSHSSSSNQPKPEESKLKAEAKELIKASASNTDYSQLAADYAIEKHQSHHDSPANVPETQSSYSQPLSTAASGYSQPLSYPQSISYQAPPGSAADAQPSAYDIPSPGAPGYEQPASAAAADAYSTDGQGYGADIHAQYSQPYPPPQPYQPIAPPATYSQPAPPASYHSVAPPPPPPPSPAYQPSAVPAVPTYQQQQPSPYSQPMDSSYAAQPQIYHQQQPAAQAIPGHAYSEITYTHSDYNGQQSGYQQPGSSSYSSGSNNAPDAAAYAQADAYGPQSPPQAPKPKKTVILAIPVKLVSKNKYSHDGPQYVQPAAAGVAVTHHNQDANDNSGNAYYSSYAGPQDKPVYNEKNEQPRGPTEYSEPIDKDHGPKTHVSLSPISNNHLSAGPKPTYTIISSGGKPGAGPRPIRGSPKPYGGDEYEVGGGLEAAGAAIEGPIELSGHEQLAYGPPTTSELEPASLQALSYLPADPFAGPYGQHGPAAAGGPPSFNGNPLEILYAPPTFPYGKPPPPPSSGQSSGLPFNFKPFLNFGARPLGGYGPSIAGAFGGQSGGSSSSGGSNYGQIINSILSAYGLGSSKGSSSSSSSSKPAISIAGVTVGGGSNGGGKGLSSYFNGGLDNLLKSYSSITPSYLSSLYSSASSPSKMYLPPAAGPAAAASLSIPAPSKPSFALYPQPAASHHHHFHLPPLPLQQQQHVPLPSPAQHQTKQKASGLIAAPSNIASAIEEMFKSTLNPVSKFRRPLYSDATKAITNFYKKLIN